MTREELEKKKREREKSLVISALVSLPADNDAKLLRVKPGHWVETQQAFKSNREDLQVVAVNSVKRGNDSAKIPGTDFVNDYTRRTSLPKGQSKNVDLKCFVPFSAQSDSDSMVMTSNRLTFSTELLSWPLLTPILQAPSLKPAAELRQHEYQMIALGPRALSYDYLTVLDTVYWQGEALLSDERTRSYYVTLVKPDNNKYAMPRSMLTMTSIACIVWDDVSPDDLSVDQQNALIDWIHWGGQLIVSGPSSWARLQNSFLEPYLPVLTADSRSLTTEDFAELSATWMTEDINKLNPETPLEIVGKPVGGSDMTLSSRANWLPGTGELVAEVQHGRGRVVFTGFPLSEPRIFRWNFFSSFVSTGLLRRHPRMVRPSPEERLLAQFWARPFSQAQRDARMHTNVRILTRDLPLRSSVAEQISADNADLVGGSSFESVLGNQLNTPSPKPINPVGGAGMNSPVSSVEAMQWGGSGAAWNDYSGISFVALEALRAAAGIELPSRQTIIYLLAGYLFCLVPLNWAVFKLIGKLEYAWIAAPIMAIIGVTVVTRVARLDIGFARRTTEISVLELQGGHDRGHLTQYLALYTSLSTNYTADFPENDSVALPLGNIDRESRRAKAETRNLRTNYGRSEGVTLEPLTVYSNSTEMVHAEQIVGLTGGLRLGNRNEDGSGPEVLKNETELNLSSTLLLRRTAEDTIESCWLGDLASGQAANISFVPATQENLYGNWQEDPITQAEKPEAAPGESSDTDALWIGGVLTELVRKTPLMPGQTRLFAYTNDRTSQLSLSPGEDQFDGRCLVVAHLTPQILGDVVPDLNIRSRGKSNLPQADELEKAVEGMRQNRDQVDTGNRATAEGAEASVEKDSQDGREAASDDAAPKAEADSNSDFPDGKYDSDSKEDS